MGIGALEGLLVRIVGPPDRMRELDRRERPRRRLPPPTEVAKEIAIALFEIEAGYRTAAQLERVCTPELWDRLEPQVRRHGGSLPSGHKLIRVHYAIPSSSLLDHGRMPVMCSPTRRCRPPGPLRCSRTGSPTICTRMPSRFNQSRCSTGPQSVTTA
jgi:hypothetical protein